MNNQDYDDYLRSVLGYIPNMQNEYTYQEQEDMFCLGGYPEDLSNIQDLTPFYPEIYKIIYPMVCKVCNQNNGKRLTKEIVEQMTDEIYSNVEPKESAASMRAPLKNGDVRNPNSKDPEPSLRQTRSTNYLLRDLIKILLLKEWGRPIRPPYRPPMPPPPPPRPGNNRPPFGMPMPRYY